MLAQDTTQLYEIASRHACDKGLHGPSNKWSGNNYTDVYQAYFGHRRNEITAIMEIGLGVKGENWKANISHGENDTGGASLKLWYDYFPNAKIIGLDINPAGFLRNDRIDTHQTDQGDRGQLQAIVEKYKTGSFDIIIDDGSHRADHQQITLETLFPLLKPDGLFFIEDLNDYGFGGKARGAHATPDVISTRDLFREYARSGKILPRNAFNSTAFLDDVSTLSFHAPAPFMRGMDIAYESLRFVLGRGDRGLLRREFNPTSHRIVALRKSRA
jgi:SAM-dependent methyltransferase